MQAARVSARWVSAESRWIFRVIRSMTLSVIARLRDRLDPEGPALPLVVETQQLRVPQRLEELAHEERIAPGLLGDEARQRFGIRGVAVQRVADQIAEVAAAPAAPAAAAW